MNFEQFPANIRQLVNDCNIQETADKELLIRNFIVTGANCQSAYSVSQLDLMQLLQKFLTFTETKQQSKPTFKDDTIANLQCIN